MDKRRLLPIFFVVFTNILGAGVILPILPLYAEGNFGATAFQATVLVAIFFAAQFVAAPILGRISDQVGRRPVLIVSQIGTVLSFVLFIYAETLGQMIDSFALNSGLSGGLSMLYLARTLDGLTGGNITTAQAYITDISTPETRARSLGVLGAAFGMGFVFGPAFGGFLANISLTAPFLGAAIITSISVLLTAIFLKESLPSEKRLLQTGGSTTQPVSEILGHPTIRLIVAISFIITMALAILQSTFALFADRILFPELDPKTVGRNVGILLTFVGIFSVINQLFIIGPLVKRFGERKVVILASLAIIVGYSGYLFVNSAIVIVILSAPISFGVGLSQPTLQSLITRFGTERSQGRLLGFFQSANNIALILGPIWAGYVFDHFSPRAPFAVIIPFVMIAVLLSIWLLQQTIPESQSQIQSQTQKQVESE